MVCSSSFLIDPKKYLRVLRQKIILLEESGCDSNIINTLKAEIKNFCISSEIYLTMEASEQDEHDFLYSCSSLVDYGITNYANDNGWQLLLSMMGQIASSTRIKFIRVFFVKNNIPITTEELETLEKIIKKHIRLHVSVGLLSHNELKGDVLIKRNMAIFGKNKILSATDQIQWDLGLDVGRDIIDNAIDKHNIFVEKSLVIFNYGDENIVLQKLKDIFKVRI